MFFLSVCGGGRLPCKDPARPRAIFRANEGCRSGQKDLPDLFVHHPSPVQTFTRRVILAMVELEKNLIANRPEDGVPNVTCAWRRAAPHPSIGHGPTVSRGGVSGQPWLGVIQPPVLGEFSPRGQLGPPTTR